MKNSINEFDNIFKEKLADYEEDISPHFWNKLSIRLYGKKIISGVVAILILLFSLIFWITPEQNIAATKQQNDTNTEFVTETDEIYTSETNLNNQITHNINNAFGDTKINTSVKKIKNTSPTRIVKTELIADEVANNTQAELNGLLINSLHISTISYKNTSLIHNNYSTENTALTKPNLRINFSDKQYTTFSRFSFSIEMGYDVSWKYIESDNQYNDFKDYRIENEQTNDNLSFGIKFNYQYKNWIISTGLSYSTISERINYNMKQKVVDPNGGYYNIDPVEIMIYDADLNLVPMVIGYERTWVDEYKYDVYNVVNSNQYNYLEIPISLGYKFNLNKFSICPTAGISFGFLYSASGKLPQMDSIAFSPLGNDSKYLQKSISNINFALSFEYFATPNYGLYIKPFYKQGLNSIYTNYPLSAKFRNAGIKFGINIYIN